MIHQRIIDAAADRPDASVDELAADVPGASAELVERVLDEYGDPADTDDDAAGDESAATATDTDTDEPTDTDDAGDDSGTVAAAADEPSDDDAAAGVDPAAVSLTEKQRETLAAIRDRPTATQRELAAELGVTAATISQRVNGVTGFEWSDRAAFAAAALDDAGADADADADAESAADLESGPESAGASGSAWEPDAAADLEPAVRRTPSAQASPGCDAPRDAVVPASDGGTVQVDVDERLAQLDDRLARLDDRLDELAQADDPGDGEDTAGLDPRLAAKVVRACMAADDIDDDEELDVIESLLG